MLPAIVPVSDSRSIPYRWGLYNKTSGIPQLFAQTSYKLPFFAFFRTICTRNRRQKCIRETKRHLYKDFETRDSSRLPYPPLREAVANTLSSSGAATASVHWNGSLTNGGRLAFYPPSCQISVSLCREFRPEFLVFCRKIINFATSRIPGFQSLISCKMTDVTFVDGMSDEGFKRVFGVEGNNNELGADQTRQP